MICSSNGTWLWNKKGQVADKHIDTDKLLKHFVCLVPFVQKYVLWLHFCEVLVQAKLTYNDRTQISSCLWYVEAVIRERGTRKLSGRLETFYIQLGGDYMEINIYKNSLNCCLLNICPFYSMSIIPQFKKKTNSGSSKFKSHALAKS